MIHDRLGGLPGEPGIPPASPKGVGKEKVSTVHGPQQARVKESAHPVFQNIAEAGSQATQAPKATQRLDIKQYAELQLSSFNFGFISEYGVEQLLQAQKPETGLMHRTEDGKFILSYKNKSGEFVHAPMTKSLAEERVALRVRDLLSPKPYVFDNSELFAASVYDHGSLTQQECEEHLQPEPPGTGIVHYYPDFNKFLLSFKDKDGSIKHEFLPPVPSIR